MIHRIAEYYAAVKKNGEALYILTWKSLQDTLLREKASVVVSIYLV